MTIRRHVLHCIAVLLCAAAPATRAQEPAVFPTPGVPIRIIVPATAGGTTDIIARVVATQLEVALRTPVTVEDRSGGGGVIGAQAMIASRPDGHTILFAPSALGVRAAIDRGVPFVASRDMAGIGMLAKAPSFLVVSPKLGVKTLAELIALGRSTPGGLNYGSAGIGSTAHLHGAVFAKLAGFNAQHVPYRGTPEAINDVIGGRIAYAFAPAPNVLGLARSGQVLVLGSSSPAGKIFLPDVDTLAQAGLPGYDGEDWFAALAPAKTPATTLAILSRELAKIMASAEVRETLTKAGARAESSSPEAMDGILKAYVGNTRKLADDMHVTID